MQGEISIISYTQMTPSCGRKQRGTKDPLDESESEKAGLKLNIQGEMYRESNMEICNTICKIDSQQEFAI